LDYAEISVYYSMKILKYEVAATIHIFFNAVKLMKMGDLPVVK
jgi:hypothetical protein